MSPPSAALASRAYEPPLDPDGPVPPDVSGVVTEDDTPVDNFPSEKQQRLLTEPLYSSWSARTARTAENEPRPFLAAANVGLFVTAKEPAIVPDMMLALDIALAEDWWKKENRSYFVWELGKTPDIVIEIVSNREGNELGAKLRRYEWMRVPYYVVWDPSGQLGGPVLRAFELRGFHYEPLEKPWFDEVGLGLAIWEGAYEGRSDRWIRWCDADGKVIPTGAERANAEQERADAEKARADRLAARLRALGIDPEKG